jgi:hypothetical protein
MNIHFVPVCLLRTIQVIYENTIYAGGERGDFLSFFWFLGGGGGEGCQGIIRTDKDLYIVLYIVELLNII